jgi:ribonuclease E
VLESHTHFDARREGGEEGRRDRRSRDRYGRDRRERAPREDGEAATDNQSPSAERINYIAEPAPASAPAAPAQRSLPPRVQPYSLPVDELAQVAQGSGLQWVNSDADKIAAAQAAIAAEPKPVHVPRERPPVTVLDEGPLVLVETRKDLGEMRF